MKNKKVLIIVENLPLPFDRRVWQEANTLRDAGYTVSIICPKGRGYESAYEEMNGIAIYRHSLPIEANGAVGYLVEYSTALLGEFRLSLKVLKERGFDVIQACNPPDNIFIIGLFYKLFFGKRFVFDHHDINPELYIAKFGKKNIFYHIMLLWERMTFMTADLSIATNESYRCIAIERGKMRPQETTVVRSGPSLVRMQIMEPVSSLRNGGKYLIGYVGTMGQQEGIDHLLLAAKQIVFHYDRKDIRFTLIGGGPELENMRRLSHSMGLDKYVTFTGRIPDQSMLEILNTADVCVNPDVANPMNDKSTMNKIMEYMALGKPVVQYDLTEGRYSAQKASLYAERNNPEDLADKIVYLLDRPELRKEMGAFGLNRVKNELHWGIEAPKYLGVYERLFEHTSKL